MKMLKKLLAVALAGVMAVSMLAGCGSSYSLDKALLMETLQKETGYTLKADATVQSKVDDFINGTGAIKGVADTYNTERYPTPLTEGLTTWAGKKYSERSIEDMLFFLLKAAVPTDGAGVTARAVRRSGRVVMLSYMQVKRGVSAASQAHTLATDLQQVHNDTTGYGGLDKTQDVNFAASYFTINGKQYCLLVLTQGNCKGHD